MNSEAEWAKAAQQFQSTFGESWTKALQSFQTMDMSASGAGFGAPPVAPLNFSPAKLEELQQQYVKEATELWNKGLHASPVSTDKRFAGDAWSHNPLAAFSAAAYLLNARTLMGLADAVEADDKVKARVRFAV
jgi:polyhydroxyalkanoate synthase